MVIGFLGVVRMPTIASGRSNGSRSAGSVPAWRRRPDHPAARQLSILIDSDRFVSRAFGVHHVVRDGVFPDHVIPMHMWAILAIWVFVI
jgi:hypothetical protein